ncbi:MAG: hypothetical protein DMG39_13040 [Acidobacteria bacterium]|nr:MAG: hypothetical protein DMG39_13040 [Acidobacteriota bacterium]
MEKVENRNTYKLKLTTSQGVSTHVWIDAQTFLETKIEGEPRRLDGTYHPVEVYFRDYRQVSGLLLPLFWRQRFSRWPRRPQGFEILRFLWRKSL